MQFLHMMGSMFAEVVHVLNMYNFFLCYYMLNKTKRPQKKKQGDTEAFIFCCGCARITVFCPNWLHKELFSLATYHSSLYFFDFPFLNGRTGIYCFFYLFIYFWVGGLFSTMLYYGELRNY